MYRFDVLDVLCRATAKHIKHILLWRISDVFCLLCSLRIRIFRYDLLCFGCSSCAGLRFAVCQHFDVFLMRPFPELSTFARPSASLEHNTAHQNSHQNCNYTRHCAGRRRRPAPRGAKRRVIQNAPLYLVSRPTLCSALPCSNLYLAPLACH